MTRDTPPVSPRTCRDRISPAPIWTRRDPGRQGELWRALLSAEKRGSELLECDNYLDASGALANRMAANARRAIAKFWLLMLIIGALVIGGIVLLVIGGSSQIVAGATSILAALGLTWKGLGGALGQLVGRLEQPVWGAVLDMAIADAITLLPGNKGEKGGRRRLAIEWRRSRRAPQRAAPAPSRRSPSPRVKKARCPSS